MQPLIPTNKHTMHDSQHALPTQERDDLKKVLITISVINGTRLSVDVSQ